MKQYLTTIFILCGILSVIIGYQFDVRWNGIVSWGLALIFFIIAAYFTKYINDDKQKECNKNICEKEGS